MTKKTYKIKYEVRDSGGNIVKDGVMRVKNNAGSLEAKCRLEEFLKRKHHNFHMLVVHECTEDIFPFDSFSDIFKGMKNPFDG